MIAHRLVYPLMMIIITIASAMNIYDEEHLHTHIPFCMDMRMGMDETIILCVFSCDAASYDYQANAAFVL